MPYLASPADRLAAAPRDREKIPRALLRAMLALVLACLAVVTFAVVTDRPHEGVPQGGTPVTSRLFILEGRSAQAVTVRDPDGTLIAEMDHGGFVTVLQSGVERVRTVARITDNPPVRITRYDNGRLVAEDPATGWSTELYAFGRDNEAAIMRLLDN